MTNLRLVLTTNFTTPYKTKVEIKVRFLDHEYAMFVTLSKNGDTLQRTINYKYHQYAEVLEAVRDYLVQEDNHPVVKAFGEMYV